MLFELNFSEKAKTCISAQLILVVLILLQKKCIATQKDPARIEYFGSQDSQQIKCRAILTETQIWGKTHAKHVGGAIHLHLICKLK